MSTTLLRKPGASDFALLVLLGTLWSLTYIAVKWAMLGLPPLSISGSRAAVALGLLAGIVAVTRDRMPRGYRTWALIALNGFLTGVVPFVLISVAARHIGAGTISVLIGTQALWAMILVHLFAGDERITWRKATGMTIGFLGIVVLVGGDALRGLGDNVLAQLAVVGAALAWAAGNVVARFIPGDTTPLARSTAVVAAGATMAVPLALIVDQPWTLDPTPAAYGGVLLLGSATAASFIVFMRLVSTVGVNFVAWANFASPPLGLTLGALLLGEHISLAVIACLAFLLAGMGVTYWPLLRPSRLYRPGSSH